MNRFSRYERIWARWVGTATFFLLLIETILRGHP